MSLRLVLVWAGGHGSQLDPAALGPSRSYPFKWIGWMVEIVILENEREWEPPPDGVVPA